MANFDRFAIDKARELQGQPPLTDAEFEALNGGVALLEVKKPEEEIGKEGQEGKTNPPVIEPEVKVRELTEEEEMAIIEKRTGRKITSWDSLKPTEKEIEKKQNEEEREADKLSWGLKNKKFNNKQLENYIADSRNPEGLVYAQYKAEALAEDSTLKEDDIEAEFEEKFGLDQDKGTRAYKQGQKQLAILSERLLRNNYGPIMNLDTDYSAFENEQNNLKSIDTKVQQGLAAYDKSVNDAVAKLRKIKTQFSDDEEYEVESIEESLTEIGAMLRDKDFARAKIIHGYTPDQIADIAFTAYLKQNFPTMAKKIVDQALLKKAKGVRGIPPAGAVKTEEQFELTPEMEVMVSLHKEAAEKTKQPVAN